MFQVRTSVSWPAVATGLPLTTSTSAAESVGYCRAVRGLPADTVPAPALRSGLFA